MNLPAPTTVLAGDVGGTKTYLSLAEIREGVISFPTLREYVSKAYDRFEDLLSEFRQETGLADSEIPVALGIAGPVSQRRCKVLNLPWVIDAVSLEQRFGLRPVSLLNDFEAVVHGIPRLSPNDTVSLHAGSRVAGGLRTIAVLGAGTGLGEAGALIDSNAGIIRVIPSEGGHSDFAPQNEEQIGLLRYLQGLYGHVSYERILSGPGLADIYGYLSATRKASPEIQHQMAQGDPASVITKTAIEGKDPLCEKAVDLFISIYGAEAGNLALKFLSRGGVYLAGGIAPKVLSRLQDGTFLRTFFNKGRYASLMNEIPVSVITNVHVGLLGAASVAFASSVDFSSRRG